MKFYCIVIFLICSVAYSQTDTINTFVLPEMKLERIDKKNTEIVFEEGYHVKVLQDSLLFSFKNINYPVAINNLRNIKLRDGTHFWKAAGICGAVGFGLGFLIGLIPDPNKESDSQGHPDIHIRLTRLQSGLLVGSIVGLAAAVLGGILGILTPDYDEYEIIKISNDKKRAAILKAFRKNRFK